MAELKHYQLWNGRVLEDLPRPGRFEVISWQMNVTVYPPSSMLRVTSAITDPRDYVKLHTAKFEVPGFDAGTAQVLQQAAETLRAIGYVTGLSKGI